MKNSILCGLAAMALTLSFFFEKTPEASKNGTPHLQTASLLPELPVDAALGTAPLPPAGNKPSFKDSLFYRYHSQTLGVRLDHTENKQLIETVTEWLGTPYRS